MQLFDQSKTETQAKQAYPGGLPQVVVIASATKLIHLEGRKGKEIKVDRFLCLSAMRLMFC